MAITYKVKVGNGMLEGQFNDLKTACMFGALAGALPSACDACGSQDVHLNHRKVKGFDFYGVRCKACGAELKFGQHKEGGSFFVEAGKKMEVYQPTNDGGSANNSGANNTSGNDMTDARIPF
jgi:hypothetical protein